MCRATEFGQSLLRRVTRSEAGNPVGLSSCNSQNLQFSREAPATKECLAVKLVSYLKDFNFSFYFTNLLLCFIWFFGFLSRNPSSKVKGFLGFKELFPDLIAPVYEDLMILLQGLADLWPGNFRDLIGDHDRVIMPYHQGHSPNSII